MDYVVLLCNDPVWRPQVTTSDVDLAAASEAMILGFNTEPSETVLAAAKEKGAPPMRRASCILACASRRTPFAQIASSFICDFRTRTSPVAPFVTVRLAATC